MISQLRSHSGGEKNYTFGIIDTTCLRIKTSYSQVDTHSVLVLYSLFQQRISFSSKMNHGFNRKRLFLIILYSWLRFNATVYSTNMKIVFSHKKRFVICPSRIEQIKMQMPGIYFQHAKTLNWLMFLDDII